MQSAVDQKEKLDGVVDIFSNFTIFILVIVVLLILVYSIIHLIKNPAALKKTLFTFVVLGVIFLIVYMLSDGSAVDTKALKIAEGSSSKFISAGINFSFVLGAIAFIGFIFDTVRTLIKS